MQTNIQKKLLIGIVGVLAFGLAAPAVVVAHDNTEHQWDAASDNVWRTSSGECWGGSDGGSHNNCGPKKKPMMMDDPDSDGDGVPDSRDACPGTPLGTEVDDRGCELDSDGDGVLNSRDRCPTTPRGEMVDENGCHDADGDGVPLRNDKCPHTRRGARVDVDGCEIQPVSVLKGVNFHTNSAKLTEQAKGILNRSAATLMKHPDLEVEIAGHTDSRGSASYNKKLSQRRAQSVVDYLVGKGCSGSTLRARGYGEAEPIASNKTREGRLENRRVELRILSQ